jgi:hypothetical protein
VDTDNQIGTFKSGFKGGSMKLIEALKQIKDLTKKAEDLRKKVALHSAYLSLETPVYPNQKGQVKQWIQAHSDVLKEILKIRVAIQRTNLATNVTIELGGKSVVKTIAEWVHRRRDLAKLECSMWRNLTDKGLQPSVQIGSQKEVVKIEVVRCYDPLDRDNAIDVYDNEPSIIDAKLEVVNAITDLIE